jgi:hypothetical protein
VLHENAQEHDGLTSSLAEKVPDKNSTANNSRRKRRIKTRNYFFNPISILFFPGSCQGLFPTPSRSLPTMSEQTDKQTIGGEKLSRMHAPNGFWFPGFDVDQLES